MVEGAYRCPGGRLPVIGFTAFSFTTGDSFGDLQCGRAGFAVIWIQRAKSRASLRVASRHGISTAHRNRNHRNRSMP
jgi:hypothetical protein